MSFILININLKIIYMLNLAISSTGIFIAVLVAVIAKKWELIKFWLFLKLGIKFKDKAEIVENITSLDYDAFINYK